MKKFFARNIDRRGRLIRGLLGVSLIAVGLWISAPGRWTCFFLVLGGGFCLFEAARGWCVMRACGVKTKY